MLLNPYRFGRGTIWNLSDSNGSPTLSNENKTVNFAGTAGNKQIRGENGRSAGKVYLELTSSGGGSFNAATPGLGVSDLAHSITVLIGAGGGGRSFAAYGTGKVFNEGAEVGTLSAGSYNNTIQVAIDNTAGKIWFGVNNTWIGDPAAGTGNVDTFTPGTVFYPAAGMSSGFSGSVIGRFVDADLLYSPPSGFSAWG